MTDEQPQEVQVEKPKAKAKGPKTFKVRCRFAEGKFGFIGQDRVRDGQEITVTEKQFSERWMVKI